MVAEGAASATVTGALGLAGAWLGLGCNAGGRGSGVGKGAGRGFVALAGGAGGVTGAWVKATDVLINCTGTTTSAIFCNKPLCKSHNPAPWISNTPATTSVFLWAMEVGWAMFGLVTPRLLLSSLFLLS
jgi:hypothetical protein